MGVRSRHRCRRKIARNDAAPAATHRLPDELLDSVNDGGQRLDSAEDTVIVLDKATAQFSLSSLPNDIPYVSDKATRIRVVGGEDGPVHIAILTKHFLKVFMQAEGNSQWMMKTRIVLWRAIRELFGEKKPQPHITKDKLKEIVWVAERSIVLGTEEGEGIISMDLATMELKRVNDGLGDDSIALALIPHWLLTRPNALQLVDAPFVLCDSWKA
ncbi:hypothetical protein ACQ4PT_055110 [Festuca glaucescens]